MNVTFAEAFKDGPEALDQKGPIWMLQYLGKTGELSVKCLADFECYDLDAKTFISEYLDIKDLNEPCQRTQEFLLSLAKNEEEKAKIRDSRSASWGNSWSGGGFGVEGAIKGAATAGMMNLGGSLAAGTCNMVGGVFDWIGNSFAKNKFMNDPETRQSYINAVSGVIAWAHLDLFKYTNKNCPQCKICQVATPEEYQKAKSLYRNLTENNIPESKIKDVCVQILQLNPYHQAVYEYIFNNFHDPNGELNAIAEFSCIKP